MTRSKFFRTKNDKGSFDENIYFAVDSENVDFEDGQNLKEKMTSVDSSLTSLQNNDESMGDSLAENITKLASVEENLSTLSTELSEVKDSLSTTNRTITNLQTTVETISSKTNTLEGQVKDNSNNITTLQQGMTSVNSAITTINSTLAVTCRMESTSLTCTLPDNL